VPTTWAGSIGVASAIVAAVTLGAGVTVLLAQRRAIRGTTLVGPWWWALAAVIAWSAAEVITSLLAVEQVGLLAPWRLAAMVLSLCPAVSLIGAKRPQHAAWNFVVLALWCILALPAAENALLHPGQKLVIGDASGWLLWILILLGPINFVPTRFWLASLLVAVGQSLALSTHLPLFARPLIAQAEVAGLALCGLGIISAAIAARRKTIAVNPYDVLWLDFRDSFGLFWSLRVQERINAAATQRNWNLELAWGGFVLKPDAPAKDGDFDPALRTALKGLLRRFVSHDWMAQRLEASQLL